MNSTSEPKNGLLAVLAVVLLGDLAGQGAQLGGHQAQALGLQAGDDLADQAAGDAVGLDEDKGAIGHGDGTLRGAARQPELTCGRRQPR
jgi:hypothetical protein